MYLLISYDGAIAQATFRKYGCYSQLHPGTSLRILGLFPLVADALNPFIWKNSTDPWNQVLCF